MNRFFRKLLGRPAPLGRAPLLLSAPWTALERDAWARFLAGPAGVKLVQRLRCFEAANAISGCQDVLHTAHSAGRAMGYGECVEHLISLSCSCDAQQEIAIGAPGAAPADETNAQAEARELAELLGRMSP